MTVLYPHASIPRPHQKGPARAEQIRAKMQTKVATKVDHQQPRLTGEVTVMAPSAIGSGTCTSPRTAITMSMDSRSLA
ncbi:hypothetical protein GCM10009528_22970 [Kineococcus aurantiacus]